MRLKYKGKKCKNRPSTFTLSNFNPLQTPKCNVSLLSGKFVQFWSSELENAQSCARICHGRPIDCGPHHLTMHAWLAQLWSDSRRVANQIYGFEAPPESVNLILQRETKYVNPKHRRNCWRRWRRCWRVIDYIMTLELTPKMWN